MGWFTDYLEKLSLIDYAAGKLKPAQKPSPFLWKPFSRKAREAYFAEQEAHRKKAEERFAHEKAQRKKMYAEQDRLHAMRQKWADEMREIQKPNEKLLAMKKETNKNESHKEYD